MLHDIGKNGIVPIINTQHRRLTDYEFDLIRMHPETGAKDLASVPDFACYADIAHGHHRTYDGTGGYPDDFDIPPFIRACPVIVSCTSVSAWMPLRIT